VYVFYAPQSNTYIYFTQVIHEPCTILGRLVEYLYLFYAPMNF